jgi:MacB-like periplasmic core domain
MNVRLGVYALLFLMAADRGVALEYWALDHALAFLGLLAVLATAAHWARGRASDFANAHGYSIQFEDLPPAEIFALNLRQEADPHPGAAAAQPFVRSEERFNSPLIGLNLGSAPALASIQEPPIPVRIRFEQLLLDFRAGARTLRQAPAFSAVTILLIALGLGANLAIYSIIHSVLSRPAPGTQGNGLVMFGASLDSELAPGGPLNSYPNYLDLAAQTKTMSALTASTAAPAITLTLSDGTYAMDGELVASNYFQILGVPIVRGRYFTDRESLGSAGLAAVIAYPVWQNYFHAAENVIGQRVSGASPISR